MLWYTSSTGQNKKFSIRNSLESVGTLTIHTRFTELWRNTNLMQVDKNNVRTIDKYSNLCPGTQDIKISVTELKTLRTLKFLINPIAFCRLQFIAKGSNQSKYKPCFDIPKKDTVVMLFTSFIYECLSFWCSYGRILSRIQ